MASQQIDYRRWRIEGRVQGVFFRASTRRQAERLGLTGHAINLSDGAVEVLACGSTDSLKDLEAWLQKGPPAARVDRIEEQGTDTTEAPALFTTG